MICSEKVTALRANAVGAVFAMPPFPWKARNKKTSGRTMFVETVFLSLNAWSIRRRTTHMVASTWEQCRSLGHAWEDSRSFGPASLVTSRLSGSSDPSDSEVEQSQLSAVLSPASLPRAMKTSSSDVIFML